MIRTASMPAESEAGGQPPAEGPVLEHAYRSSLTAGWRGTAPDGVEDRRQAAGSGAPCRTRTRVADVPARLPLRSRA